MSISIFDTGTANIASLEKSLDKINVNYFVSKDIDACIRKSKKIILPGIGNMNSLIDIKDELKIKLSNFLKKNEHYLLGICLGAQIMLDFSEESKTDTLGLIEGDVKKVFDKFKINLNIGYKTIDFKKHLSNQPTLKKLFYGIPLNSKFYFLHKYYLDVKDERTIICESYFEKNKFTSIMIKNNIIGVQFHPELSKENGLNFLENFSKI